MSRARISGSSPRQLGERLGLRVRVDEQERPPDVDARGKQRPVGLVEARLAVGARRRAQRAVEVVRPRVVVALDRLAACRSPRSGPPRGGGRRSGTRAARRRRSRMTSIGTPPASVVRNEPGSATWSARPPYCQERAKIRPAPGGAAPRRCTSRTGGSARRWRPRRDGIAAASARSYADEASASAWLDRVTAPAAGLVRVERADLDRLARRTAQARRRRAAGSSSPARRSGGRPPRACRRTRRRRAASASSRTAARGSPARARRRRPACRRRRAPSIASTIPSSKNCTSSIPTAS